MPTSRPSSTQCIHSCRNTSIRLSFDQKQTWLNTQTCPSGVDARSAAHPPQVPVGLISDAGGRSKWQAAATGTSTALSQGARANEAGSVKYTDSADVIVSAVSLRFRLDLPFPLPHRQGGRQHRPSASTEGAQPGPSMPPQLSE